MATDRDTIKLDDVENDTSITLNSPNDVADWSDREFNVLEHLTLGLQRLRNWTRNEEKFSEKNGNHW
jgi:hypothetical protein